MIIHGRFARLLAALGLLAAAAATEVVTAETVTDHAAVRCVGCHGGSARIFVDPATGEKKDVTLDFARFGQGDHAKVDCLDCHVEGFLTFPHFEKKSLACMDCHPREEADVHERTAYDFLRIEREYKRTVHFIEYRDEFTCMECHNPHYFQVAAHLGPPQTIIEVHNEICLRCHTADATGPLADPADPNLVAEHAWLPHPELHLDSTRCIECHTETRHAVSHQLLIEDEAECGCVSCHTRDTVLLERLYRHEKPRPKAGFDNAVILEDAYVMGANRHVLLDWLTYVLVGAAFLFVAVHGALRVMRRARRTNGGSRR